jgi:hypothetical protein
VGGKAQISSEVPDPLILSQINASNVSVDADLSVVNNATINNISVGNDMTITRFLDAGKPSFIMCIRTGNIPMSGSSYLASYNTATTSQQNGQFSFTDGGTGIAVNTGGWYRVSWAFGFVRTANTNGDRAQVRSYCQTRLAVGGYAFNNSPKIRLVHHVI